MNCWTKLRTLLFALSLTSVGTAMLAWLLAAGTLRAANCNVPSVDHDTIQEAVDDSNCDIVSLAAATYTENITVTRSVTIQGQGSSSTTVNGGGNGDVLTVDATAVLTITGVSISLGGIENYGEFVAIDSVLHDISGSTLLDNNSGATAKLYNIVIKDNDTHTGIENSGLLTVEDCTISGNSADYGAGIANERGTVTVTHSVISDNSVMFAGGVHNEGGTVTVTDSVISGNVADLCCGGIQNKGYQSSIGWSKGAMTIVGSTISGNSATDHYGGGVLNGFEGTMAIINSTISGNAASGSSNGGGIRAGGTVTVVNSTISGNTAGNGGGIYGTVAIANSIIAGNPSGGDCSGTIVSLGYNLASDGSCNLNAVGDRNDTSPGLGPLQENGGPTPTHALQPGSLAIDAGSPVAPGTSSTSCPATDQRGIDRPRDGDGDGTARCDIGAFELTEASDLLYLPIVLRH